MPYTIAKSDGTFLVTVNDLVTDKTATSLSLPARGVATYGLDVAENFVYLVENFAATTSPARPLTGQLWFDKTVGLTRVYGGSSFSLLGADGFGSTIDTLPGQTLGGNNSSANRIGGATGVPLAFAGGVTTVTVITGEGKVIAVGSPENIVAANLPANITLENKTFVFSARFPNGLSAGMTLATDSANYSYAGSSQFSSTLLQVPYLLSGDDIGTTNQVIVSIPSAITGYTKYLAVESRVLYTNTGATTININGIGAVPVLRRNGIPLVAGDLQAGFYYHFIFDGNEFRVDDAQANGYVGPTGPPGPQGPAGAASSVAGPQGPQGPAGANGLTSPATTSTLGGVIVGAGLVVTSNGTLSVAGGATADGNTLTGAGTPAGGLGQVGDYYLDTQSLQVWGPKSPNTGWGNPVTAVVPRANSSNTVILNMATDQAIQPTVLTVANMNHILEGTGWFGSLANGRFTFNTPGLYSISANAVMELHSNNVESAYFVMGIFISTDSTIGGIFAQNNQFVFSNYYAQTSGSSAFTRYCNAGDIISLGVLLHAQNYDDTQDLIKAGSALIISKVG